MTKDIKLRLDHIERVVSRWSRRLSNIEASRKHYLRVRMATRTKMFESARRLVKKMGQLEALLGQQRIRVASDGGERIVPLLSKNQRTKLRHVLADDYRRVFRCSSEESSKLRRLLGGSA